MATQTPSDHILHLQHLANTSQPLSAHQQHELHMYNTGQPLNPVQQSINALGGDKNAINAINTSQNGRNLNTVAMGGTTNTVNNSGSQYNMTKDDFNNLSWDDYGFAKLANGQYATRDGLVTDVNGYNKAVDSMAAERDKKKMDEFLQMMHAQYDPIINQYNSYLGTLGQQHQNNLNSIDAQSNRTLQGVSDNNFLASLQNEQQLSDRGMGTSGVGDDFRARNQMSANRNLQDAYMQAANFKNQENTNFSDKQNEIQMQLAQLNPEAQAKSMYQNWLDTTGGSKGIYQGKIDAAQKAQSDQDAADTKTYGYQIKNGKPVLDSKGNYIYTLEGQKAADDRANNEIKNSIELQKLGLDTDKFLSQDGKMYYNGQPLKDAKGNQIYTLDFQKFTSKQVIDTFKANETARHNQAVEKLGGQKLAAQVEHWQNQEANASAMLGLKGQALQNTINKDIEAANNNRAKLQDKMDQRQYDMYKTTMTEAGKQIAKLQAIKKPTDAQKKALKEWTTKYAAAQAGMANIIGNAAYNGTWGESQSRGK
jgi:hypothetical protein